MPVFVPASVKHILKHHSSWVEHFSLDISLWSILDHIQSALWYEDSPWWLSWRLADKTMYILFYPLKFPSTPVLIPFKVLQHHNNLLWPRTGLEPAFIHRYRDYLQTCAYFLIQHLAARDTVSPPVGLCILHTPLRLGRLFHLPTRSYGREDRTRTCDPQFPKLVF